MMDSTDNMPRKRKSGKRSRKRKFTGNVYTRNEADHQNSELNQSTSGRKIDLLTAGLDTVMDDNFKGYCIIDTNLVLSAIEKLLNCKQCGSDVILKEEVVCGLSSKISIECKTCDKLCCIRNSKMLGSKNNIPEINRRYMYAMRSIGMGHAAMKIFCGIMDLPPPVAEKSYNAIVKKLVSATNVVAQNSMKCAAREEVVLTNSPNVVVSGDGTWKTRGHTSRVGVCAVIGDKCGKVVDTEVLSSYCKECDTWDKRKGTPQYDNWKLSHEKECLADHTGSAGKMEVVGMVRIFQRSESVREAKYVGYIGDGDAKTFQAVVEAKPYDSDTEIEKIECVGHIQKRMGTRLRKMKQSGKKCSDGKSIGGKGRLTDKIIDKITSYYGNAIREHKHSLAEMRRAVWAVFFHTRSNNAEPLHSFCPTVPDSWCQYQKAVAAGNTNTFSHKKSVPTCVMDAIKPIFNDLSHPKLLRRCLGGKTQNANESFNSLIWKLCPKTHGAGKRIVEIATNEAVVLFNDGNQGRLKVMAEFGLATGICAANCFLKLDRQRVATGELRFLQSTKEMRKIKRRGQKATEEEFKLTEGTSYAPGGF